MFSVLVLERVRWPWRKARRLGEGLSVSVGCWTFGETRWIIGVCVIFPAEP